MLFQKEGFKNDFTWEYIYNFVKSGAAVEIDPPLLKKRESENKKIFNPLFENVFKASFRFDPN